MAAKQVAFIDRSIDDLDSFLAGLRPDIDPVVLEADEAAPAQIARYIRGRTDVEAVHVVAHGKPGAVAFGAGALTLETIDAHAQDLRAIGVALGGDRELLLWSCRSGEGRRGSEFVEALAAATGTRIAAASRDIGSAATGGCWDLDVGAPTSGATPPLTAKGLADYAFVMAVIPGTAGPDTLDDTSDDDQITGEGGNDRITVTGGDDEVDGGADSDRLIVRYDGFTGPFTGVPSGNVSHNGTYTDASGHSVAFTGIEQFFIFTGSGNDIFTTGDGDDTLDPGDGDDEVHAGAGNDSITVDSGADIADGGSGNDRLFVLYPFASGAITGGPATGSLATGYDGSYTEAGGSNVDFSAIENFTIFAGDFDDIFSTGDGDDFILAGLGLDDVHAGLGNDTFEWGPSDGQDIALDGGGGSDTLNIIDTIFGDFINVVTDGFDIVGLDGGLTNVIGVENANLDFSAGGGLGETLSYDGTTVNVTVDLTTPAATGFDNVFFSSDLGTVLGGSGNDTLTGHDDFNGLSGMDGNDTLNGMGGVDVLAGGLGDDIMNGGGGDDFANYIVGDGQDTIDGGDEDSFDQVFVNGTSAAEFFNVNPLAGTDQVGINIAGVVQPADAANSHLAIADVEDVQLFTVNGAGDTVTVSGDFSDAPDFFLTVFGGDGNDTFDASGVVGGLLPPLPVDFFGDLGDDILIGGAGDDFLEGEGGADTLTDGEGDDDVTGGLGNDTFNHTIDSGFNFLDGGDDNDTLNLFGTSGDDIIAVGLDAGQLVFVAQGCGCGGFTGIVDIENANLIVNQGGHDGLSYLGNVDPVTVNLTTLTATGFNAPITTGIVDIHGGMAGDTLIGDGASNEIVGFEGDDDLQGAGGDDIFIYEHEFGDGVDTVDGGEGGETLGDLQRVRGTSGADTFFVNEITATQFGINIGGEAATLGNAEILGENVEDIEIETGDGGDFVTIAGDLDDVGVSPTSVVVLGGFGEDVFNASGVFNDEVGGAAVAMDFHGFEGDDQLTGGGGHDFLDGGDDNDTLAGNGGNDTLVGGAGNDTMSGHTGNDNYYSDVATDVIVELAGPDGGVDTLFSAVARTLQDDLENLVLTLPTALFGTGNAANNVITGNTGNDTLEGGGGNDRLKGGLGNDILVGGADNDTLIGGAGVDDMSGGDGDDIYDVDETTDEVTELDGEGTDLVMSTAPTYTLSAFVENLTLAGAAAINGVANGLDNVITGNGNVNTLSGGGGNDTINGGGGGDTLNGDGGNDVLNGGNEGDTLNGGADEDSLNGGNGVDSLFGDAGNDALNGGSGADAMAGGGGNDTYIVDNSADGITEDAGGGTELVLSTAATYTLSANVENLTLIGTGAISGTGNGDANVLRGNNAVNTLDGGGGDDTLRGEGGADNLIGGSGNDSYYLDGADVITELDGGGTDTVYSAMARTLVDFVENLVLTSATAVTGTGNGLNNVITGNVLNDVLSGEGGNDVLKGGLGDDMLTGGAGADSLRGGGGNDTLVYDADDVLVHGEAGAEDVLRILGGGTTLNLIATSDAILRDIEVIDLTGSGDNTLVLDRHEVLALSSTDELRIDGDLGDALSVPDSGTWSNTGPNGAYNTYVNNLNGVTLLVDMDISSNLP